MGGGFRRNSVSELKLKNRCTGSTRATEVICLTPWCFCSCFTLKTKPFTRWLLNDDYTCDQWSGTVLLAWMSSFITRCRVPVQLLHHSLLNLAVGPEPATRAPQTVRASEYPSPGPQRHGQRRPSTRAAQGESIAFQFIFTINKGRNVTGKQYFWIGIIHIWLQIYHSHVKTDMLFASVIFLQTYIVCIPIRTKVNSRV